MSMRGIPGQSFLVDMDHPLSRVSQDDIRCDFLFVGPVRDGGEEWVAPIELKGGGVNVSEVKAQLQAGANFADEHVPHGERIQFLPIVASGKLHKDDRRKLRLNANRISFRGRPEFIQWMRCGDNLSSAFSKR